MAAEASPDGMTLDRKRVWLEKAGAPSVHLQEAMLPPGERPASTAQPVWTVLREIGMANPRQAKAASAHPAFQPLVVAPEAPTEPRPDGVGGGSRTASESAPAVMGLSHMNPKRMRYENQLLRDSMPARPPDAPADPQPAEGPVHQ